MADPSDYLNLRIVELADQVSKLDMADPSTKTAIESVVLFSKIQLPEPKPETEPAPVNLTRWGKVRCEIASALDNETTRALIKAGGAFAGVGLVVWSTIHRDHVLERNALNQANQRPM